jgi:hypothetical protein
MKVAVRRGSLLGLEQQDRPWRCAAVTTEAASSRPSLSIERRSGGEVTGYEIAGNDGPLAAVDRRDPQIARSPIGAPGRLRPGLPRRGRSTGDQGRDSAGASRPARTSAAPLARQLGNVTSRSGICQEPATQTLRGRSTASGLPSTPRLRGIAGCLDLQRGRAQRVRGQRPARPPAPASVRRSTASRQQPSAGIGTSACARRGRLHLGAP